MYKYTIIFQTFKISFNIFVVLLSLGGSSN
nr:MAG TPA: hypothetical protein [Crassvirales sp.]